MWLMMVNNRFTIWLMMVNNLIGGIPNWLINKFIISHNNSPLYNKPWWINNPLYIIHNNPYY